MGNAWRPPTSPKSRSRRTRAATAAAPPRSQSVEALLDSPPSPSQGPVQRAISAQQIEPQQSMMDDQSEIATSENDTLRRKRNFVDRWASKVRSMMKK